MPDKTPDKKTDGQEPQKQMQAEQPNKPPLTQQRASTREKQLGLWEEDSKYMQTPTRRDPHSWDVV